MSFIVVELHCKSGGFTRDVHLFVCSFIYRLKRVLVGHWHACSSASGRSAVGPPGPRVLLVTSTCFFTIIRPIHLLAESPVGSCRSASWLVAPTAVVVAVQPAGASGRLLSADHGDMIECAT